MRPYGAWVATSRQRSGEPPSARQREDAIVAAHVADLMRGEVETASQPRRLPSVRLAPRDELAGLARVAPLLRAAGDLGRWAERRAGVTQAAGGELDPAPVDAAASAPDLAPRGGPAAWRVGMASAQLGGPGAQAPAPAAALALRRHRG